MAMVFCVNKQHGFDMNHLEELEILTVEDREAMPNGSQQEYTWSLVSREVRLMRHECPDFMDQSLILTVQEMITKGRGGAGLITLTYAHGVTGGIQFVRLWLADIAFCLHVCFCW
eukprot:120266_1